MSVIIDSSLEKQIQLTNNLHMDSIKFAALIGYIDSKNNQIKILKSMNFDFEDLNNLNYTIDEKDINHLLSLNITLPYPLEIVGILFYKKSKLDSNKLTDVFHSLSKLKHCKIISLKDGELSFYSLSNDKLVKLTHSIQNVPKENLINLIYTMEFEASDDVLNNITKMKETIFSELKDNWNKITTKKKNIISLEVISKEKKQLDRILELVIPPDETGISTQLDQGSVYLAYDLHMNIYPLDEVKTTNLNDLNEYFLKALSQDLQIKLQRSYFDDEYNSLMLPKKIRVRFLDLELNTYFSRKNPSKFEFDMLSRLLSNVKTLDELNHNFEARIFLKDLYEYFLNFPGSEIITKIEKIMEEM